MIQKTPARCILLIFYLMLSSDYLFARTIKTVVFKEIGVATESAINDGERKACEEFRPTRKQIIRYFNHARPVASRVVVDDRFSVCVATGSLTFSDGTAGDWLLYSSGGARFSPEKGDDVYLLYKRNKWVDPWACGYGGNADQC